MEAIGERGNILKLFKNFITNHKIQVKISDKISKKRNVTTGVPRGSILGPLYIIFVSLVKKIFSFVKRYAYADDIALIRIYKIYMRISAYSIYEI